MDVFVSVGKTSTARQESFVSEVERLLRAHGLEPRTVGRNSFSSGEPLLHIRGLMGKCAGTVIVAFERLHIDTGTDRRGSAQPTSLADIKLPTVWNQIEAALAYAYGHPLLVIVENGVRSEGLLERGYDWYVQWVDMDASAFGTSEFQGIFADWIQKVKDSKSPGRMAVGPLTGDLTIRQLVLGLTPGQLWGTLAALGALVAASAATAFKLGQWLHGGP